jgi:hypothetical protein
MDIIISKQDLEMILEDVSGVNELNNEKQCWEI